MHLHKDQVSANGAIWVPKTSQFQSGHRVAKNCFTLNIINIYCML